MNKMKAKRKLIVLLATGLSIGCLTSCADIMPSGMIIAGSSEGIREFGRAQNGLITTGKSAPNVADEYHSTQRATDRTSLELLQLQLQGEK